MSDRFPDVASDEWLARLESDGSAPQQIPERQTVDGVTVRTLYTGRPSGEWRPVAAAPRGEHGWTLCARVEAQEPLAVGEDIAECLEGGAAALWLPLDRAARLGIEPDAPEAAGHVGRGGITIHHGDDLAIVLEAVALGGGDLEPVPVRLDAGANALPLTALWLEAIEARGWSVDAAQFDCGADPLGSLARDGALPRDLMKLESEMAVLARYCARRREPSRAITVSTTAYHAAGADVVQELAFGLATAADYLAALERSGMTTGEGAAQITFRCAVGTDLFVEIAKLRALRLLWSMLLAASDVSSPSPAVVHAVGAERSVTQRAPANNLLRATAQVVAAACADADSVTLQPYDQTLGSPAPRARRLARTAQLVLAAEARLGRVRDPAGGAYAVEALTRQLAERAWNEAARIAHGGGIRRHLLSGELWKLVARKATERRAALDRGELSIVGVSRYALEHETPLERSTPDFVSLRTAAVERLYRLRERRASRRDEVPAAGYGRDFVVDELRALAASGATLAELGERLGGRRGGETVEPFPVRRDAAPLEEGFRGKD